MEEKNENVVEETTQETNKQTEETNKPEVNEHGDFIVKLDDQEQNETKEKTTENTVDDNGVVTESEDSEPVQKQEEVQPQAETQEDEPVLEEIKQEENKETVEEDLIEDEVVEEKPTEVENKLPESVQKLVNFIEETGGDLNDYVKLNQDYSKFDDSELVFEYYKQTKPHLNLEEINFLLQDQFSYDEEQDEEIDIKRKQLAFKEQVASARSHLDGQKSRYYEEIKAGSRLTPEQQKAVNFFNRYNKESEANQKAVKQNSEIFTQKTNKVFNDEFKGFEYNVGDKSYRFNVKNVEEVKNTQSDLNNFTKKFLDKKMALKDAMGYHKSLYTAMNADAIAKHFYEQGKADAMKDSINKSKNIDMSPRQAHNEIKVDGIKARIIGESSSDFKFKIRNKNKN